MAWSEASLDELDPVSRAPLNEERLLIRRGRLRAEAQRDALSLALELDGNTAAGPAMRLVGAHAAWSFARGGASPLFVMTAGLVKIPFGADVPASEREKPFLEPPAMSRALFPGNYDAGVVVSGRYGLARWSFAAMNGAPVGDAQWRGRDPAGSYDFIGRIGGEIGDRRFRVEAGVSALTGSGLHPGTPPTKDAIQWVDDNQNGRVDATEIQIVPGGPGSPSETFSRDALGADLAVHWCLCVLGTGTASFEAVIATNLDRAIVFADPIAVSRDVRELGISIGAVQNLGEQVQIGARYDRYDADRDARDRQGVDLVNVHKIFSTLSVMASARWHDARITAQYDHERNPFGRGDNGAPITRAADRVTLRAQVGF